MAVFHGHLTLLLHHGDLPPATTAITITLYNTMSDTSAYGDDIRDDDTLVDDDNSSVRSFGSVSTVVWKGPNPSLPDRLRSYWQDHTPLPPLDDIKISSDIPNRVDVVIIGSGMTGVGVALSFLQLMASKGKFPVVLVIEAGEICSGMTALSSGYIKFLPHVNTHEEQWLPIKVLDLQVKNAHALKELASRSPHAHAREFETEELHFDPEEFEERKAVVTDPNGFMGLNEQYPQYKVTILEGDEVPNVSDRYIPACLDCLEALTYSSMDIHPRVVLYPTRQRRFSRITSSRVYGGICAGNMPTSASARTIQSKKLNSPQTRLTPTRSHAPKELFKLDTSSTLPAAGPHASCLLWK